MTHQELLDAIHIDIYTNPTQTLLTSVVADLEGYLDKWTGLERELPVIIHSLIDLGVLSDTPNQPTPEAYFELMRFGHFKECYRFSPSFIIKFCAERNPTNDEAQALEDAFANDMDDVFLPTKYYPLPYPMYANNLERDDEEAEIYDESTDEWIENPEWHDDTVLTAICIQPRVISADCKYTDVDHTDIYNKPSDAECNVSPKMWPVTCDRLGIPFTDDRYEWRGLNGVCALWAKDFKNLYGLSRLKQFAKFCEEFHIWDLHSENVGYTLPGADGVEYPVILDWMSR